MENKRFHINFFDIVIIVIVVITAFILIYMSISGRLSGKNGVAKQVTYTFEIRDISESTRDMIHEGDIIVDKIKKYQIGKVKSVSYAPYELSGTDYENQTRVFTDVPGRYNANIVITADCVETEDSLTVSGGFYVRVGTEVSILGPGYSGAGYIIAMERE